MGAGRGNAPQGLWPQHFPTESLKRSCIGAGHAVCVIRSTWSIKDTPKCSRHNRHTHTHSTRSSMWCAQSTSTHKAQEAACSVHKAQAYTKQKKQRVVYTKQHYRMLQFHQQGEEEDSISWYEAILKNKQSMAHALPHRF
eukprot:1158047-Pelagomonas_calceolata.AAC.8